MTDESIELTTVEMARRARQMVRLCRVDDCNNRASESPISELPGDWVWLWCDDHMAALARGEPQRSGGMLTVSHPPMGALMDLTKVMSNA